MTEQPAPVGLHAVLDPLGASLEGLATQTCAQIYAELESYADIPRRALTAAVTRNLTTALTALHEGRVPAPEQLDGAAQTAKERFEAGIPVEEIVRGFRISIALIHERFVDLAVTHNLPAPTTVGGVRIMWGVADAFTTRIITEYHALEVGSALRDAQRRASAVRALLAGEAADSVTLAGLDAAVPYAAIRCDVPSGTSAEEVRRRLEASGSTPAQRAFVVVDGRQCRGLVVTPPAEQDLPVGLGPFVPLGDLARSDRVARQSLRLAQRIGRVGVQGVAQLGWRLAAASRADVWEHYADAFLAPLAAEGSFGAEVLAAVQAWLQQGRSIPRAAASLNVHVNTVRYRLARFCDLTGCDLDDIDDLVGLAWVVELGQPDRSL